MLYSVFTQSSYLLYALVVCKALAQKAERLCLGTGVLCCCAWCPSMAVRAHVVRVSLLGCWCFGAPDQFSCSFGLVCWKLMHQCQVLFHLDNPHHGDCVW